MALSNFDTTIMKVVQVTHHQGDIRYGMSRCMQCSSMSLMLVYWTLFKSVSKWDSFDLDLALQKWDLSFKSLNNYRHLGMEDLPQEFFIENSSTNVEFLNIRTGKITAGTYVLSIAEIMGDCQQIGTGALLVINNYILGLLLGNQCFFFYLAFKAKMKFKECQPQVQQFCKNLIRCSHLKIYKISIFLELPNDPLLPSTIFTTKTH